MNLQDYIRDIQDFPKPGIGFKDITPLLISPEATAFCLETLVNSLQNQKIDKVIGVESRGFFFGILLAQKLNAGFIPVRKPKKLPFELPEKYAILFIGASANFRKWDIKAFAKIGNYLKNEFGVVLRLVPSLLLD